MHPGQVVVFPGRRQYSFQLRLPFD
ncbi:hypothetical protein F4X86_04710 [Candidatus Saccharibacteria bacterium]|nr:hypothetical protein [Candidatus Saccharibacteria bacterium]